MWDESADCEVDDESQATAIRVAVPVTLWLVRLREWASMKPARTTQGVSFEQTMS
jgi:hypothetical protein